MPLPEGGNVAWPPKHTETINTQLATWAAWFSGDAEQLAHIYAGTQPGPGNDTTGFFASQTGGFKAAARRAANAVRRWFWGNQAPNSGQRNRLHVPLAGDIAAASADLLFSEPPTVTIPTEATDGDATAETDSAKPAPVDPTQARLDELVDEGMHATLLEAAEICAALGGVYLRIMWDPQTRPDRPWISAVHPDVAVPEWRFGKLVAVTFWRELKREGRTVVRHLERHEPGRIQHGVYQGDAETLGQPVPLTDYPETAPLAKGLSEDGVSIDTGVADRLTAVYVPNMRPNRVWRNVPAGAYLGRSDYAGVEALMDALDLAYSSLMRDVDLGKARLIVPREMLRNEGPGKGASLDLDREVYEGLNMMSREDGKSPIEQVQFDIRVEEHQQVIDGLKATIVSSAGYSAQTFGLGSDGQAVTATEIAAKNRRSLITRDRKARYWAPALVEILHTLLAVDAAQFKTKGITPQDPVVEFADAVGVDPLQQAQTLAQLETAGAISTEYKVRTLHPDWADPEVAAEVRRIREDQAMGGPDPAEQGNTFARADLPPDQEPNPREETP